MKLVEEGKLALDDSVRTLMPELPARYGAVTFSQLLSHQSGIREHSGLAEVFSTRHCANLEEAARAIFVESPLVFKPEAKTADTTYGYTLLGAAIERAAGQLFQQILEARLSDFSLDDDDGALTPGGGWPYRKRASMGWATGLRGDKRYFTYGDLQPGTTTVRHWFPDSGAGSVILCNAEGPELDGLHERILGILVGRRPQ